MNRIIIEFIKGYRDFAIVHIRRHYRAITKHDFSRPAIPDSALYLRKAYKALIKEQGRDYVDNDLIIPRNLDTATISAEVNNLLVRAGFRGDLSAPGRPAEAAESIPLSILQANYQRMLLNKCGLKDDPDTASFLSGILFKSSTYTNYESHTSPEAQARLYTVLQPLSTQKRLAEKSGMKQMGDATIYTAVPKTNHEVARVIGSITLQPGQRIRILVPHGVRGYIDVG